MIAKGLKAIAGEARLAARVAGYAMLLGIAVRVGLDTADGHGLDWLPFTLGALALAGGCEFVAARLKARARGR